MLVETMDPFDQNIEKDCLFNIVTGKQTSEDAAKFLLSMEEIGNQAKHLFDVECQEDEERFERAIKKQKVHTFATDIKKTKLKSKDGKLVAACMMRDLFGCILKLSLEKKIDMAEVLKFPLTPVPLSLSHVDGTMQKTQKATLLKHLESRIESEPPRQVDITIVDAMFFLHLQGNHLPSTFGGVARSLLSKLVSLEGK